LKPIKLQHRTYLGKDSTTTNVQYRANIPHEIITKLNWTDEKQIILHTNTKKKVIVLELKANN